MKNKKYFFKANIYIFALIFAVLNILLFYKPLFAYIVANVNFASLDGKVILMEILLVELFLSYVFMVIIAAIPYITKPVVALIFISNSVALYFEIQYNTILDVTMMGNVFNTNPQETANLLSYKLIIYVLLLGVLPSYLMCKIKIVRIFSWKKMLALILIPLVLLLGILYLNSRTWLWLDKNLKVLGALSMPFSYSINAMRYKIPLMLKDKKEYQLPNAIFKDGEKTVVVLVIGESARAGNFSLYGYNRNTNPNLEKIKNLVVFPNTTSCATYTTAGVGCMLSAGVGGKNYERLPTYLKRHDVKTFWRSTNWGEPHIDVDSFAKAGDIKQSCTTEACKNNDYDDILLYNLNSLIKDNIQHNNVFIVLHTSTSHGPTYYKKYPSSFEKFAPVCKSTEIKENCTPDDLVNAYDNTILYTDHILSQLISQLRGLNIPAVMIYMSDHGESLGENNTYLHGMPNLIAPDVQRKIPFLVWMSPQFIQQHNIDPKKLAKDSSYSQDNIFHTIMGAFGMQSEFYQPKLDVLK
ncbi:MAG: phosphoethanolamine--lipid A transferase EptA [Alphaproteobacteria bacterium]|nr:phosphoethanolamine--lipid A transferase EptA [Alphaproteobacteria bacterium]